MATSTSTAMMMTVVCILALAAGAARAQSPSVVGCSDGQREGFVNIGQFPAIAGCAGAWTVRGVLPFLAAGPQCNGVPVEDTTVPRCGRVAGDDSDNRAGTDCAVSDLCAAGWHVCASEHEVASLAGTCAGATSHTNAPLFFATRQSTNGCGACAIGSSTASNCNSQSCATNCAYTDRTTNDVAGCGNYGGTSPLSCGVLNHFTHNLCSGTGLIANGWNCDLPSSADNNGLCEALTIRNSNPDKGGVLCCKNAEEPPLIPQNCFQVDCGCTAVTTPASSQGPFVSLQFVSPVDPDNLNCTPEPCADSTIPCTGLSC